MPEVSVVIPAYNVEQYIQASVDSALAQTYRDLEVIVVDNGSTDATPRLLAAYGDRIVFRREARRGVAQARNTGVASASGRWIAFLDSDDVWSPVKIEHQLSLARTPVSYTDRINFGDCGDVPHLQSTVTPMFEGDIFERLLLHGNFVTTSGVLVQRDLFSTLGGFVDGLGGCEDWDLWLRAAEHHRFSLCLEPLVHYRMHHASLSFNHRATCPGRRAVIARALSLPRGQRLDWRIKRKAWAETFRTNGWDAGRAGARAEALRSYARAAIAWPLAAQSYKEALRVCLNV